MAVEKPRFSMTITKTWEAAAGVGALRGELAGEAADGRGAAVPDPPAVPGPEHDASSKTSIALSGPLGICPIARCVHREQNRVPQALPELKLESYPLRTGPAMPARSLLFPGAMLARRLRHSARPDQTPRAARASRIAMPPRASPARGPKRSEMNPTMGAPIGVVPMKTIP